MTVEKGMWFEHIRSEVCYEVSYTFGGMARLRNEPCELSRKVPISELSDPSIWRKLSRRPGTPAPKGER